MDFFEDLRQGAHNKFKGLYDGRASPPHSDGYMFGVSATIKTLKEMFREMKIKGFMKIGSDGMEIIPYISDGEEGDDAVA